MHLGEVAVKRYGAILAILKKEANLIGSSDLLISAHARSMGAVLVTNNVQEFNGVPNLRIENWISDHCFNERLNS